MKVKGADRSLFSARAIFFISFTIVVVVFSFYALTKDRQLTAVVEMARVVFTTNTTLPCRSNIQDHQADQTPTGAGKPDFKLFIGILTLADRYWQRSIIRLAYGTQARPPNVEIDIKFVFCNLSKEEQRVLVGLEIMHYNDIIILNCHENMNSGKTLTYFSSLPDLLTENGTASGSERPYDYVMKADDDIYFRLGPLVESLRPLPREDLYYGLSVPCNDSNPFGHFMYGMGYIVSWDIVEWMGQSEIAKKNSRGGEDGRVGYWLNTGGRARNRYNTNPAMYDLDKGPCPRHLSPDTIGVHRVKDIPRWVRALQYFNATDGIKPSKLYHL